MTDVLTQRDYVCSLTDCRGAAVDVSTLNEILNIASEMHSNASRGPPSCCLRAYFMCFTWPSKSCWGHVFVFGCNSIESLMKSAVLAKCALIFFIFNILQLR